MEFFLKQSAWITLICILSISISYASDGNSSFYVSGKFITGLSDIENFENSGTITGTARDSEVDDIVISTGTSNTISKLLPCKP